MKLFEVTQLQRPFVYSWPPSVDVRHENLDPVELYDFGVTTAQPGVYEDEDAVIVVANSQREALQNLKAFLSQSGYLEDTYGTNEPTWIKSTWKYMNQTTANLNAGKFQKI